MPIPIPPPSGGVLTPPTSGGVGLDRHPLYIREPQNWALEQERYRHVQALYHIGEWAFIVLMWHELDFVAGLVQRCTRCFVGSAGTKSRRIAEVYKQPIQNECPVCFGTTFDGGYRARIVRPVIVADVEESEKQSAKGTMYPAKVTFETTYDFRCRQGDYIFRADGSRWRVQSAGRLQVRTGFKHASQIDEAVAYKLPSALEDLNAVAYEIPPTDRLQISNILRQEMRFPGDFSLYEIVTGPLIPPMSSLD